MRTRIIAALLLTFCFAPQLLANCEECASYFHWQAGWCKYCAPAYCGFFQCELLDVGPVDYCWGGSAPGNDQCFTLNQSCVAEPSVRRLDETWRLKDVRIVQPKRITEPATAAGSVVG
jgi:hypothetical protein